MSMNTRSEELKSGVEIMNERNRVRKLSDDELRDEVLGIEKNGDKKC